MIILKMQGGIGNQLFQYVFGRTAANLSKTKLILETSCYQKGNRKFALDELRVDYDIKIKNRFLMKVVTLFLKPRTIKFDGQFQNIKIGRNEHVSLLGFWDTYQPYPPENQAVIDKELVLKNPSKKFLEHRDKINPHNRSSILDYLVKSII